MSSENELNFPQGDFEQSLSRLVPNNGQWDRERLFYEAGFAAGRVSVAVEVNHAVNLAAPATSRHWGWPTAFCGLSVLAASLMVALFISMNSPSVAVNQPLLPAPIPKSPASEEKQPSPQTFAENQLSDNLLSQNDSNRFGVTKEQDLQAIEILAQSASLSNRPLIRNYLMKHSPDNWPRLSSLNHSDSQEKIPSEMFIPTSQALLEELRKESGFPMNPPTPSLPSSGEKL